MDILLFRDLQRLQRTGNFSQAATLSNLSQPAFSRRIKSLETWVGATLVDRSHQPVTLTEAGTQMLEAGLQAVTRIETERSQIREAQSLPDKYVVTFGTQHSIGWRYYPAWLQALEHNFGPFLSRLRADDLPDCMRDLKQGSVDFVIAYHNDETIGAEPFDSVVIGNDALIPVCKPNPDGGPMYNFDSGDIKMPHLRFGDAAPIGRHLKPLFETQNLNAQLRTVYENAMAGALRIRARAGDGVAWLPKSVVQPDIDSKILVPTGRPDWQIALEIRLYRNLQHTNTMSNAIWSYLSVRQDVPLIAEI